MTARAWSPLEGADYDALTLREKVREHTLLANRAQLRAGPMWTADGGGRALNPDEMSDEWHALRRTAGYHLEEVERLKKRIIARDGGADVDPDFLKERILSGAGARRAKHHATQPAAPTDYHGPIVGDTGLTAEMLRRMGRDPGAAPPESDPRFSEDFQ